MSVNCEMAKMIFIKFSHLEKRVLSLEEKCAEQGNIIEQLLEEKLTQSPKNETNNSSGRDTTAIEVKKVAKKLEMSIQGHPKNKANSSGRNTSTSAFLEVKKVAKKLEKSSGGHPKNETGSSSSGPDTIEVKKVAKMLEMSNRGHQNLKVPGNLNVEGILNRNLVVQVEQLNLDKYRTFERPMVKSENFENENIQQKLTFTPITSSFQLQPSPNDLSIVPCPTEANEDIKPLISRKRKTKLGSKSYICSVCSHVFNGSSNLAQHMRSYHNKSFKCHICEKLIGTKQNLDKHLLSHKIKRPRPSPAKTPNKLNKDSKNHGVQKSKDLNRQLNPLAQKIEKPGQSTKPNALKINRNSVKVENYFNANHGVQQSSKDLNRHPLAQKIEKPAQSTKSTALKINGKVKKPYKCGTCGKYFAQNHYFQVHQRIHTGLQLYKCQLCDKQFTIKTNLDVHQRVHTGEQPFSCDDCGRKFSQKSNLKAHIKRTHNVEKPYGCSICMTKFSTQESLQAHISLHST